MNILNNPNIEFFRYKILEHLNYHLSEKNCSTLANILAIDYITRLNSIPDVIVYIDNAIDKIKKYLGKKTITTEDFGIILELFAVAISNDNNSDDDVIVMSKEQSQEIISNLIIEVYFKDLSKDEKKSIKIILKNLTLTDDIFSYIESNSDLFKKTILSQANNYKVTGKINENVNLITEIINNQKKLNVGLNSIKQLASKAITSLFAISLGAFAFATAGLAFSALLVPSAVITLRYAPIIGEKLGKVLSKFDFKNITTKKEISYLNKILEEKNYLLEKNLEINSSKINLNFTTDINLTKHINNSKDILLQKQVVQKNTKSSREIL
jgi:hypothetical protein